MATERSSWAVGYSAFASVMLMLVGVFHVFAGIIAIAEDQFFAVSDEWVFQFDVTTWGWIHLIGGIIVFAAGIGIYTGNVLARTVGVIVAALSAVANFLWLPYSPVWSVVMIAVDIAIIWALTIHGRDLAERREPV